MTSRLRAFPDLAQLIVEPHLNLCESAAYAQLQLPQDLPQAVC